ncbi:MAG: hypothetical protein KME56_05625 [Candidatus Thiodiazotropha sp. (ex Ctena orbiculata)]|uniref:Uncharacterized protein n=1 Tax=Candidatus Thiodiazotropha taylori TaxID=2792791 RepID=A0A944M6U0_9GAMM|nr:hypothetical protein [Candidatus Thiodiazotropha taylori]PUB81712.1 MAG: hypothetical protein DBP00_18525 [gamma proteobacterium symbiont of Ctena orbiculata]MBT2988195.1 hypothetical protein [Candidatus Thiodiazotropha taylori]MBT2996092.1 hypothetical protein [Candidatus Thiodiazotropha taylori]MBT2999764.1 hypothetical protein [Candidatus Thiodiazotropha taylori]
MRISEHRIHCEMCHLLEEESGNRGFTIQVPIDIASQNEHLLATIFCRIDAHSHQLTLQGLSDAKGQEVTLSESENSKLASVLKRVEESRICGNAKICPQRIVQLVSELHNRMKE